MKRFVLFLATIPILTHAGWTRTYGGDFDATGYCVEQTIDGGYIITGEKYMWFKPGSELWLIKTDPVGDTLWTRSYFEHESTNYGYCVQQTSDTGFVIVGCTDDTLKKGTEVLLMKTDSIGDVEWIKKFHKGDEDRGLCVRETEDTGFIIASGNDFDIWVFETDPLGNEIWSNTYDDNGWGPAYCIEPTNDGGYIVFSTGYRRINGDTAHSSMLKLNEHGDSLWMKFKEGSIAGNCSRSRSGLQTHDGGFIVTGEKNSSLWLLKTDSGGENEWEQNYPINVDGLAVIELEDSSIVISGNTIASVPEDRDIFILKTDMNGDTLWSKTYGRNGEDYVFCMDQTKDNGFILTGSSLLPESHNTELFLVKIDSTGDTLTAITEQSPAPSPAFELLTSVGPQVVLRFSQSEKRSQVSIFDVSGSKVDEIDVPQAGGVVEWGEGFSPGVYFIRPKWDNAAPQKAVLIR